MKRLSLVCFAALLFLYSSPVRNAIAADASSFTFQDTAGDHLDILLDGKMAARFMYAHDVSSKERRAETYKPYLHVFDAEGKEPITKGPGGVFPHHRGLFIGWMSVHLGDQKYDTWHMPNSDIITRKIVNTKGGADEASFTAAIDWVIKDDKAILSEQRTIAFHRGPAPARLTIDFTSQLKAVAGDLTLDGDPEHAGVQFRPAADVETAKTTYFFPVEHPDPHKDLDYPWVGETFTLHDQQHSVVDINSPENPKGTRFSAYRDYGRFGAFPKTAVKDGQTLTLKYRFLISDGPMLSVDAIQKSADQFTGAAAPTVIPPMTERQAEKGGTPKPKTQPAKKPGAAN